MLNNSPETNDDFAAIAAQLASAGFGGGDHFSGITVECPSCSCPSCSCPSPVLDRSSVSPSDGSIPSVCQSSEPEFEAEEVEKDVPGSAGRNTVDDEPPDEPAWLTEAGRCLFEMFASAPNLEEISSKTVESASNSNVTETESPILAAPSPSPSVIPEPAVNAVSDGTGLAACGGDGAEIVAEDKACEISDPPARTCVKRSTPDLRGFFGFKMFAVLLVAITVVFAVLASGPVPAHTAPLPDVVPVNGARPSALLGFGDAPAWSAAAPPREVDDIGDPTVAPAVRLPDIDVAACIKYILGFAAMFLVVQPSWIAWVAVHLPRECSRLVAYGASLPFICVFQSLAPSVQDWIAPKPLRSALRSGFFRRVVHSANEVQRCGTPATAMISLLVVTSAYFCSNSVASRSVPFAAPTAIVGDGLDYGGTGAAGAVNVDLSYFPDSCNGQQHFLQSGLVSSSGRSAVTSAYTCRDETKAWGPHASLPKFTAVVDSGCSAHSTESIDRLVNPRQCFEVFGASNGRLARATSIGDLPVLAKSASGAFVQFTIKDVRHIPDFCYTLLSVRQLWD